VRRHEWLLVLYFVYTSLLALALDLRPPIPAVTVLVNLLVVVGYRFLVWADSFRQPLLLGVIRDWFPLLLALLAYRQMGWFAPERREFRFEQAWILLDRWLLRQTPFKAAIEAFGPLLPSILELSYSLVYTLAPLSMAALYLCRKRQRADILLGCFLFSVLLAYAQFPMWPSEPPRALFPNEDLPGYFTAFRKFNLSLLGSYGIHTSVFPSAHVSGAYGAAFGMWMALPERPWIWRTLLILATLIAIATIYGRYHYTIDAIAGVSIPISYWLTGRARAAALRR
jgi:membrane-associated phospholipid phosphatase